MAEDNPEQKKSKRKSNAGVMIPAGLFIGMGVGWILGHLVPGLFIGLGVGLLLYGIVMMTGKD